MSVVEHLTTLELTYVEAHAEDAGSVEEVHDPRGLSVLHTRRVDDLERAAWDRHLGAVRGCDWRTLRAAELAGGGAGYHYFVVSDATGEPVAMAAVAEQPTDSSCNHLYLDRAGPWQSAFGRLLAQLGGAHRRGAGLMVLLRDLPTWDETLVRFLSFFGFLDLPAEEERPGGWIGPTRWRGAVSRVPARREAHPQP